MAAPERIERSHQILEIQSPALVHAVLYRLIIIVISYILYCWY